MVYCGMEGIQGQLVILQALPGDFLHSGIYRCVCLLLSAVINIVNSETVVCLPMLLSTTWYVIE